MHFNCNKTNLANTLRIQIKPNKENQHRPIVATLQTWQVWTILISLQSYNINELIIVRVY